MGKPKLNMNRPTESQRLSTAKGAAQALEEGESRLAVNLPIHVHRRLKIRAVEEGKTVRSFLLDLLAKNGIA